MRPELAELWVYLSASPLAALTVTLAAWLVGVRVNAAARGHALANPVLIAAMLLVGLLVVSGVEYQTYFEGAQFVHFLLGPATVALAVPLVRQWQRLRASGPALVAALVAGSAFAAGSAVAIGWALGADQAVLATLAPKATTTPVAMGIAEQIGGIPSLAAVVVILSGIAGASLGPAVLTLLRVRDWRARGFAVGLAAHGIGTARALSVNETAGAFAALAMGLNALATALLLPLVWALATG